MFLLKKYLYIFYLRQFFGLPPYFFKKLKLVWFILIEPKKKPNWNWY